MSAQIDPFSTQSAQPRDVVGRPDPLDLRTNTSDEPDLTTPAGTSVEFEEYLDLILIGGKENRPIVIDDYDESWPHLFERQRARIASALGHVARRIEHIGSTSVPGLAAKPIIDILVAIDDVENEQSYVPALEASGYVLRIRELGHLMLRTPDVSVHVHVWTTGSDQERRLLLFRDWLRCSREDRNAYERFKRQLSRRDWADRSYYARAKGPLIAEIVGRAESWAARTGWSA
jgi:GrpB-like predicted nucleotidyltransferase (UPF0157 family)